ncbi:phosphotransferase [Neobacillus sp. K501]
MAQETTQMDEILAHYFAPDSWTTTVGKSGANNTTRFVQAQDERFVLRIYETHQDEKKVIYEHAILLALMEKSLPFSTPRPVFTQDGHSIVRTKEGKLAGLFYYLEGVNPVLEELGEIVSYGRLAGQLSSSLAQVQMNKLPVYRPYYEIESAHPHCPLPEVLNFCSHPSGEFLEQTSELKVISNQLVTFIKQVPMLKQLPHQLVHGDLNGSNILVDQDGNVSAVLDFEFVTHDLRVMELAVCLSDFIRPNNEETLTFSKIEAFLSGYGQTPRLTKAEIQALPVLIQLRSLDVFIHFLGRYWDGVNPSDTVQTYIQRCAGRCDWIQHHQDRLIALCKRYVLDY